jgi:hypothetical protein
VRRIAKSVYEEAWLSQANAIALMQEYTSNEIEVQATSVDFVMCGWSSDHRDAEKLHWC